jgi:2-methylisocitrate lyase-like PEP mutase family enzyme
MSGDGPTKAQLLRSLHVPGDPVVLPNAWDVASAVVFAAHPRCRAIATTSAGVAAVLGYPDGEAVSPAEMIEAVARIAAAVDVPVTADMEGGYGDTAAEIAAVAERLGAAGAAGLNLEDAHSGGLVDPDLHCRKIDALRETGVPLVINARTDVYLLGVGEPAERFDHAVGRMNAYLGAGADSAFVPGVTDAELIGRLVEAVEGPLNVLAVAGTPPVAELARLGVARVSVGSGPMRAALALARRIADEVLERGEYSSFTEEAVPYPELNRMLAQRE